MAKPEPKDYIGYGLAIFGIALALGLATAIPASICAIIGGLGLAMVIGAMVDIRNGK